MPDPWTPAGAPASTELAERKALAFVEIDLGVCSLTYGTSPCTASVPTTGARKCFNTFADCQDTDNYAETTVTLRFGQASSYLAESGIECIPSVKSIDFSPAVLAPGEDLGTRASIRITFTDHPHSDTGPGFDKYRADRSYEGYAQGTFWAKFRARFPFLKGEPLRWRQGFLGDALGDMETRHFVIEGFDGPTPDGTFTIIAKDPLRLLEGKRANAPEASTGSLVAGITNVATSATLTPTGIGNSEYPASGYLNIGGKEIASFTRTGDTLTLTRGQKNTTAVAHDAGERCQLLLSYAAEDPADIIYDLLTTYVPGFDASWINLGDWQDETASFLGRLYTTDIAEPTSVNQLVIELVEQCGLALWWDDLNQKVRLQVLRAISTDAAVLGESLYMKRTFSAEEQLGKRISQVWTFYAQNNPLKGVEERDNYRQAEVTVNLDNEEQWGQPAIKKIFSRWIPYGGGSAALRTNNILLGRYLTPPRRFSLSLFRGSTDDVPVLGQGYLVEGATLQDATGAGEQVPAQCVSIKPGPAVWQSEFEEMRFTSQGEDDPSTHTILISGTTGYELDLRTLHDTLYPAPQHGDTVNVYVLEGARVGSTSTSTPALDIGDTSDWPTVAGNGTRTSGSAIITGLADTSDMAAGMFVRGTGIANGTKIASVDGATQITLDANATSSGTSTVTVYTVNIALYLRGRLQGKGGVGGQGANPNLSSGGGAANGKTGGAGGTALYARYPLDLFLDDGDAECWGGGGGGGGGPCAHFHDADKGGGGGGGAGSDPGSGGARGAGSYTGDQAQGGSAGTLTAGGNGGYSSTRTVFWATPALRDGNDDARGGAGGSPGQAGSAGYNAGQWQDDVGSGGAAGKAIDGVSYCKKTGTGDVLGTEVN